MIIEQTQSELLVRKINAPHTTRSGEGEKVLRVEQPSKPFAKEMTLIFTPRVHHLFYWLLDHPHQRFAVKFSKVTVHHENSRSSLALYVDDVVIPITAFESIWQDAEDLDARNGDDDGSGIPF